MRHQVSFEILGIPVPKQSARHRIAGFGNKRFVQSYQSKEVRDAERNIAYDVKSQLPEGFAPYTGPISAKVVFVFPPLKSWSKKKLQELTIPNARIYKDTKPDLTDNLMKGLFDAMEGIVFVNDSQVARVESMKIYGEIPRTEVIITELCSY